MVLTAAAGSYVASVRARFADQMLAVKEIERRGGSVRIKAHNDGLLSRLLGPEIYCNVEEASFPIGGRLAGIGGPLGRVFTLQSVRLIDTGIGDDDVRQLRNLTDCHSLELSENPLTDDCLSALSRMKHLTALDLSGTRITGKGLHALLNLKNLQILRLAGAKVGGEGVVCLAQMPQLRDLNLAECDLSDSDLPELIKMKWLEDLDTVNNPRLRAYYEDALSRALPRTRVYNMPTFENEPQ